MFRIDTPGATVDNKFTEGNPSSGTPATRVSSDWLNAIQEEIAAVIEEAGGTLNKANSGQLLAAIVALIAGGGAAIDASAVGIDDAGDFFSGTDVEAALQQLATKLYTGTLNANQVRRSIITAAGAAVSLDATHCENVVQCSNAAAITYTVVADDVFNAPIGTAVTVIQAGAGQISFVGGGISGGGTVAIKKPAVFLASSLAQEASMVLYKVAANTWRLGGMLAAA